MLHSSSRVPKGYISFNQFLKNKRKENRLSASEKEKKRQKQKKNTRIRRRKKKSDIDYSIDLSAEAIEEINEFMEEKETRKEIEKKRCFPTHSTRRKKHEMFQDDLPSFVEFVTSKYNRKYYYIIECEGIDLRSVEVPWAPGKTFNLTNPYYHKNAIVKGFLVVFKCTFKSPNHHHTCDVPIPLGNFMWLNKDVTNYPEFPEEKKRTVGSLLNNKINQIYTYLFSMKRATHCIKGNKCTRGQNKPIILPKRCTNDIKQPVNCPGKKIIEGKVTDQKCNTSFCVKCHDSPYRPGHNCELRSELYTALTSDNKDDKETALSLIRECAFCPGCNIPIQKTYGCDHMTCDQCQTHFCNVCFMRLNNNPYGQHITNFNGQWICKDRIDQKNNRIYPNFEMKMKVQNVKQVLGNVTDDFLKTIFPEYKEYKLESEDQHELNAHIIQDRNIHPLVAQIIQDNEELGNNFGNLMLIPDILEDLDLFMDFWQPHNL